MRALGVLALSLGLSACTRAEPPAGSAEPPEKVSAPAPKPTARPQKSAPLPTASAAPTLAVAEKDAAPPEPALPALLDDAGAPLPQTEDRPTTSSSWFKTRAEKLFQSIVKDDPESSLEFFFPLIAYRAVKDVADPARDYERRLIKNFKRDVHEYHAKLGPNAGEAKFLGIEVPEADVKWMKPKSEGNRIGYYRVLRSRLRYETKDGKAESLEVTSFISWRGEWYLVHLHGFK
jgi:hypothetical protein